MEMDENKQANTKQTRKHIKCFRYFRVGKLTERQTKYTSNRQVLTGTTKWWTINDKHNIIHTSINGSNLDMHLRSKVRGGFVFINLSITMTKTHLTFLHAPPKARFA